MVGQLEHSAGYCICLYYVNVIYLYSPLQQSISVYQSALQQIINKENNK